MSPPHDYLAARMRRLTETLVKLKHRVHEAIASELGSAIGEAVKDILRVLVAGRPPVPSRPRSPSHSRSRYQPDPDDWDEDDPVEAEPNEFEPRFPNPVDVPPALPTAIAVGVAAAHWAVARNAPAWTGVGLGLFASFATWCGGPVLATGIAIADLLAIARSHPDR